MNLPNKISLVRLFLIPVVLTLFLLDGVFPFARLISVAVFIIASLTDFVDGHIARKYNLVTDLGKFLDSIADKILVITALFLVVFSGLSPDFMSYTILVCAVVITFREFMISALRQIAAAKNIVITADKSGKIKAAFQMVALPFLLLCSDSTLLERAAKFCEIIGYIGFSLLLISFVLTLTSGIHYIIKNRSVLKE